MLLAILSKLADGKFHSGEQLAQELNVSRARIWQAMGDLRILGLEIAAVTGRGYKIFEKLELLDLNRIMAALPESIQVKLPTPLIYLETTSTNSVLLEGLRKREVKSGTVCLAEFQSQGRGRLGRQWASPLGNIYCSMAWQFQHSAAGLMGLSLVMGLAVVAALKKSGARDMGLKWPNDIYHHGKKLGGILVEIAGDALGPCDVVIGVGINVLLPRNVIIDQAYTDLSQVLPQKISRNLLLSNLIASLYEYLTLFNQKGLSYFLPQWDEYDILHHQAVHIIEEHRTLSGVVVGVDAQGQLRVNVAGVEHVLTSARASVRLV